MMDSELNSYAPPQSNQELKLHSADFSAAKQATIQSSHNAPLSQHTNMIKIPLFITGKNELQNEEAYDPNSLVLDQFAGFRDFDQDSNMLLSLEDW